MSNMLNVGFSARQIARYVHQTKGECCPECSSRQLVEGAPRSTEGGVFKAVSCADCGAEWEAVYTLSGVFDPDGHRAVFPDQPTPGFATRMSVLDVSMTSVTGGQTDPESAPEWHWIRDRAGFRHRSDSVWEFMVAVTDVCKPSGGLVDDVPDALSPYLSWACANGVAFICFHL